MDSGFPTTIPDLWVWNLMPLGLVKWFARHHCVRFTVRIGDDRIPFRCHALGGVLIRAYVVTQDDLR